jgi:hypothetical protein
VSDIVERLRSRGCPIRGLSQDGEECGNLHKAAAAEIEQLRKLEKDHQAILDTAHAFHEVAVKERNHAWNENTMLRALLREACQKLSGHDPVWCRRALVNIGENETATKTPEKP